MPSEPPALDIDRLLTTLDRHEVDFLLVGGVAAIAYGARRPTADLDRGGHRRRCFSPAEPVSVKETDEVGDGGRG